MHILTTLLLRYEEISPMEKFQNPKRWIVSQNFRRISKPEDIFPAEVIYIDTIFSNSKIKDMLISRNENALKIESLLLSSNEVEV